MTSISKSTSTLEDLSRIPQELIKREILPHASNITFLNRLKNHLNISNL